MQSSRLLQNRDAPFAARAAARSSRTGNRGTGTLDAAGGSGRQGGQGAAAGEEMARARKDV